MVTRKGDACPYRQYRPVREDGPSWVRWGK